MFKPNYSEVENALFQKFCPFFLRKFDLFRRCLDAEMKNGVRERLQIMNDKEEKSLWARKKKQHSGRRNFWELLQVVIKHNRFLQRKSLWAAWGRPQRYRGKQLWSWFELHYTSKKLVLMDYCIHVRLYELHGDTRTDDCIYTSNCDFFLFILRTETMRRRDTLQGISFGISMWTWFYLPVCSWSSKCDNRLGNFTICAPKLYLMRCEGALYNWR